MPLPTAAIPRANLSVAPDGGGTSPAAAHGPPAPRRAQARRWSGDGWLLLRPGGGIASAGPGYATYGASQLGAVLRYRLKAGPHGVAAYARATAAVNGSGERELAVGLSARPLADVPVIAAVEWRASRFTAANHASGGTHLRPAVLAITQLPPIGLRSGTRAEFYAAGGYVGGAGATAFVDGQMRVDHPVARFGSVELRGGGGAWGGAEQGAGRLDVGPTATLGLALGRIGARLGVDWRFRVVGNAAPGSGPALTVATGF